MKYHKLGRRLTKYHKHKFFRCHLVFMRFFMIPYDTFRQNPKSPEKRERETMKEKKEFNKKEKEFPKKEGNQLKERKKIKKERSNLVLLESLPAPYALPHRGPCVFVGVRGVVVAIGSDFAFLPVSRVTQLAYQVGAVLRD